MYTATKDKVLQTTTNRSIAAAGVVQGEFARHATVHGVRTARLP